MGSFVGHIDESIFFLVIGVWWMFNMFPRYIKSQLHHTTYTCQFSYRLPCCKRVPIEAIFKTLFPICGFIGEVWSRGPSFFDEEGNFRKLVEAQHMSIYGIFIIHGLIDLMMSCGVPLPKGSDYMSVAIAFAWYGLAFTYHAHMEGKLPMETIIHVLPTYIMFACAISVLIELWKPQSFLPQLSRMYCLLVLGTWFTQSSFIMYRHDRFPGWEPNPNWDGNDERNIHFMVAAFGYHLILSMVFLVIAYPLFYIITKRIVRTRKKIDYEEVQMLLERGEKNVLHVDEE